jgi:hypothetical protein
MSVPGVNLEDDVPEPQNLEPGGEPEPQPAAPDDADDDDALIQGVTQAGSDKEKALLSSLITYRKQAREAKKQNAELQARQIQIDTKLTEITPYVEAIRANPGLIEAVQKGTRPSQTQTIQPEDDQEAIEWAQDYGLITATGELDVARARRQLDKMDQRWEKKNAAMIAPLRQSEAQRATMHNKEQARHVKLADGSRAVSDQSIEEAFSLLADVPELTANPQVAALMPVIAAGLDVFKGRRPSARQPVEYPDPLYTEPAGGARRQAPMNAELARMVGKVGLTEKDMARAQPIGARGMALED